MSGIYFHIPFCRKACHYCDFHFSTSLRLKDDMVAALHRELEMRLSEWKENPVRTIYFGGGTPSVLEKEEIERLLAPLRKMQSLDGMEITLEANPDDMDAERLAGWRAAGINRLSVGVQSFFEEDLRWMNRSHSAEQAERSLLLAFEMGFESINLDLIFGYPLLSDDKWEANIHKALSLPIDHLSTYSMTVEKGTVLQHRIGHKKEKPMEEGQAERQYRRIMSAMQTAGWEHYEVSNFCKPGKPSRHNSAYWEGVPYLGIGPSAHGYDGSTRYWNLANNAGYIRAFQEGNLPEEREELSENDRHNEFLLTRLRTAKGMSLPVFKEMFGYNALHALKQQVIAPDLAPYFEEDGQTLRMNREGFLIADHLISQLFRV